MFNPDKYKDRIEESKRRLEIARRFEEPDRVPITISTGGSFYALVRPQHTRLLHGHRRVH
ncbi:MAG: hypothetical protein NTU88_08385 [Armatimonadetes bacterium]|nr:hypothetical protein [Armatimonadota bacterium]